MKSWYVYSIYNLFILFIYQFESVLNYFITEQEWVETGSKPELLILPSGTHWKL